MPQSSRSLADAAACTACLAGMHAMCLEQHLSLAGCCCKGKADLDTAFMEHDVERQALQKEIRVAYGLAKDHSVDDGTVPRHQGVRDDDVEEERRGDSGYIHPDAWPSTDDIGTLTDPSSTGRKRQKRMYPIQTGQVCEWAGKMVKLADLPVVIGCINSPATDRHHGPDKNTLNNEKASWRDATHPAGIGLRENTHLLCSDCHNSLHAKHDPFYEKYDRIEDQAKPWLVRGLTVVDQYEITDAPLDLLFEEEAKRAADRERRGKTTRGRKARTIEKGDFDVQSGEE